MTVFVCFHFLSCCSFKSSPFRLINMYSNINHSKKFKGTQDLKTHVMIFFNGNELMRKIQLMVECMKWFYGIMGVNPGYLWPKRTRTSMAVKRWFCIVAVIKCVRRFRRAIELSRPQGGTGRDEDHGTIYDVEPAEILLSSPASSEMTKSEYFSVNTAPDEPVPGSHASFFRVMLEWILPIANLLLELLSEVFNQISSKRQPRLGLIGMLMSLATLLVCIIELIYRGCKENVAWRIYWFFRPNGLPFGNIIDAITLSCSTLQFVFASIAYAFFCKHADDPIKLSVWPIIFAFCLLCSRFFSKNNSAVVPETEIFEA